MGQLVFTTKAISAARRRSLVAGRASSRARALAAGLGLAVAATVTVAAPPLVAPVVAQQGEGTEQGAGTGEAWQLIQPAQSTLVFARDSSLIGEIGKEWRTSISIKTIPRFVPQAFIAVEDKRFYEHDGVDVVGIAAALKDAVMGDPRGASTITQLVVGNMHPDLVNRRDRSIARKLREQQAAREMEKHYTKEQILEAFLNQISFGHGWFGIESAARHYFGKPAAKLTLAEAASLASLPKGPAIYDPIAHPDRNRERRNLVLDLMAEQKYITPAQAAAAKREPIVTAPNMGMSAPAPYLVELVRKQAERAGIPVEDGGYRIYTTIDPELQRLSVDALREGLDAIEARPGYPHITFAHHARGRTDYLQGAAIVMDAASGDILAYVGGRDYGESQFDRAAFALRQPGSAIKPIVYSAAIRDSIPANAMEADTALAILLPDSTLYEPSNADDQFLGAMTLRTALTLSRNTVAVQLGLQLGIDSIASLARRMGITTPMAPVPSSAIGASAVRPLDLVTAYTTFANLGARAEPRFIRRVEDRAGRVLFSQARQAPSFVMDPRVAFIVRDMMRDVVERGTATTVRRYVPERVPVAGKTGTTNDNTDAWFVGLTPELVAGVWVGLDRPVTITTRGGGGSLAAPIWGTIIGQYYRDRASGTWEPPAGLVTAELDRATGLLADDLTPPDRRYTEYFIAGTEPSWLRFDPWSIFRWGPIAQ
ncbi:MAG TPA: PBP1A family penicillin-binding protein [Gemmatimonadaceae bacterium]|nr:PBP1A family penicillin-binding protein [Gemmatimonadaceae bacterium]